MVAEEAFETLVFPTEEIKTENTKVVSHKWITIMTTVRVTELRAKFYKMVEGVFVKII